MRHAFEDPTTAGAEAGARAVEWRDRFKAICLCKNIEELGLPSFIAQVGFGARVWIDWLWLTMVVVWMHTYIS